MDKHNDKKNSTRNLQLLHLGIGIFVVFMLIVGFYKFKSQKGQVMYDIPSAEGMKGII